MFKWLFFNTVFFIITNHCKSREKTSSTCAIVDSSSRTMTTPSSSLLLSTSYIGFIPFSWITYWYFSICILYDMMEMFLSWRWWWCPCDYCTTWNEQLLLENVRMCQCHPNCTREKQEEISWSLANNYFQLTDLLTSKEDKRWRCIVIVINIQ